jgi:hypothetical protein
MQGKLDEKSKEATTDFLHYETIKGRAGMISAGCKRWIGAAAPKLSARPHWIAFAIFAIFAVSFKGRFQTGPLPVVFNDAA